MWDFFARLFSKDFMPHGTCYLWDPAVLWLNVVSDVLIAAAYYAIPFVLFRFVKKRRDLEFRWIFVAFGLFILACGTTHLMSAIVAWVPVYRLDGVIKAITAAASIATFVLLVPLIPALIALPSPAEMARVNRKLEVEIGERRAAEREVRRANEDLEARVAERTRDLASSESRFRQLAEAIPQLVWILDEHGEPEFFNRRWIEYTGLTVEEARGSAAVDAVHGDDRERVAARWRESADSGTQYETEYRILRPDKSFRWFLGRAIPVRENGGRVVRWFGTCTDIDEYKRTTESLERTLGELKDEMAHRRELEDQLIQSQKMEAIGRLAGGVAHDFNNLLTVIVGYTGMIAGEAREAPVIRDCAVEVMHAAERATALTGQLLAFGRRQIAQPRVLDLNQCVQRVEKMLRRIIGEDVLLETKLDPGLRRTKADPAHIDQVLMNLAVNARDAMPGGGLLLIETANVDLTGEYVAHHAGAKPGPYVMLAISDTGVGMDAGTQARIFEPFFTTKEQGKGTGLGLAIVYGIVKQNHGEVLVYSEPGHGSAFKVYLPADVQEAAETGPPVPPAIAVERGTETILLVEDEKQVRTLARQILTAQGYQVLEAATAGAALQLAQEHGGQIHLLLTDVVMPQMGGPQLAKQVAAGHPETRTLYMSGYTDSGIVYQGVLALETPFLQKPFTSATLLAKVREVLAA